MYLYHKQHVFQVAAVGQTQHLEDMKTDLRSVLNSRQVLGGEAAPVVDAL